MVSDNKISVAKTRICKTCNIEKSIQCFTLCKKGLTRRRWHCKTCLRPAELARKRKMYGYKTRNCSFCHIDIGYVKGRTDRIYACKKCDEKYGRFKRKNTHWIPSWLGGCQKQWTSMSIKQRVKYIKENYNRTLSTKCEWCSSTNNLVVDHCHETLNVRGILCHNCNIIEGFACKSIIECLKEGHKNIKDYYGRSAEIPNYTS